MMTIDQIKEALQIGYDAAVECTHMCSREDCDKIQAAIDAVSELEKIQRRYQWAANELLACDYGDNPEGKEIGWRVYGWRIQSNLFISDTDHPRIYGPSIDAAIDSELSKEKP